MIAIAGQSEIYKIFLNNPNKKFFSDELLKELEKKGEEITLQNVSRICHTLLKHREIKGVLVRGVRKTIVNVDGKTKQTVCVKKGWIYWLAKENESKNSK